MAAGLPDVLGAPTLAIGTRILHPAKSLMDPYNASNLPLYQTATFAQPSATEGGLYDYTRSGNPTRTALEEQLAALEARPRALNPNRDAGDAPPCPSLSAIICTIIV